MLDAERQKAFSNLTTALVADAMYEIGLPTAIDPAIRPLVPFTRMLGTAVTVKTRSIDSKEMVPLVHFDQALEVGKDVFAPIMVIEVPPDRHRYGIFGEGAATAARACGFVGALIEGAVRDTTELRDMSFPVFCRTIALSFILGKVETVSLNEPVTVGDIRVCANDIVFADNDGVVIIPPDKLEEVILRATAIMEWERKTHEALRNGVPFAEAIRRAGPMPSGRKGS